MTMPRPDVSIERREQILAAAVSVFSRDGFAGARMEDIASAAKLSKGAIYLYFKSKDELILALMNTFFSDDLADLRGLLHAPGSATDRLLAYVLAAVSKLQELTGLTQVVYEFYASAIRRDDMRRFFEQYMQGYRTLFAALIQQGIERGEFRPVDPDQVALTLAALFEGVCLLAAMSPDALRLDRDLESCFRLVLAGLHPPEHGTPASLSGASVAG